MNPFVKAKRIWGYPSEKPNQYALFHNKFNLKEIPHNAILRIRVDNRYSVTLNGEWIPAQQYSDYDFYPVYDEIELTPSLFKIGENTLDILAYCQNESSSTYRKGEPSLIFEMYADGDIIAYSCKETQVTTDTGFQNGEVEKITVQLSYSFRYNTRNTQTPEYVNATVLPEREMSYHPRPIPQLTVGEPISAKITAQGVFLDSNQKKSGKSIYTDFLSTRKYEDMSKDPNALPSESGINLKSDDGDGIYAIVDLGCESSGYLLLDVEVREDCRIVCGYGEHLDDLRVRSLINERNFAFVIDAVKGRNKIFWPIKRLGGRYFQIHAVCKEITLYYAGLRSVDYPYPETKTPDGLNIFQKHIYDTAVKTLRLCSHEHYEDTPWREQALYAMDSRNQMLFSYDAFGETNFAKENLRLMALGQKSHGLLELCSPAELDDKVCIPCFSLVWICALREYFERTEDTEFIREMLPYAMRIFGFFERYKNKHGLVRNPEGFWNFYEWAHKMTGKDGAYDSPLNAFYLMALRSYESLSHAIGEDNEGISSKIKAVETAYVRTFFSEEKQAYRLSTYEDRQEIYPELVQALSVLAGVCNEPKLRENILKRLAKGEFSPSATLSHRIYCYQALMTIPDMKEHIIRDVDTHWFKMLMNGATSFWETERGSYDFKYAGSLCHGWSAVPIWVYWNCI